MAKPECSQWVAVVDVLALIEINLLNSNDCQLEANLQIRFGSRRGSSRLAVAQCVCRHKLNFDCHFRAGI